MATIETLLKAIILNTQLQHITTNEIWIYRNREKRRYSKKYTSSGKDRRAERVDRRKREYESHNISNQLNESRYIDILGTLVEIYDRYITSIKLWPNKYNVLLIFRRSELNTTREKSSRDQRERPNNEKYKRRSEIDNREYYKRGDEYRRDRDYRKGYSTHQPTRGYR